MIDGRTEARRGRKTAPSQKAFTTPEAASALKTQRALRDRERASPSPARRKSVRVLRSDKLAGIPWLAHGFSTRQGGVSTEYGGGQLNLAPTAEDSAENVARNRGLFLRQLLTGVGGTAPEKLRGGYAATDATPAAGARWPLVLVNQVHSAVIHRVFGNLGGARVPEWARLGKNTVLPTAGDGLITSERGVLLGIKIADCLPVIVADRKQRAVGVFHAGWRGTVQRIVEKGVGEMRRQLGCDPAELVAAIGPGIGACCYEIGEEVEDEFDSQFAYAKQLFEDVFDSWSLKTKYPMLFLNQRAPGHGEPALSRHLDLVKANWCQLLDAGVPEENIESLDFCTACRTDLFFSYRKERVTGRMLAVVGMR